MEQVSVASRQVAATAQEIAIAAGSQAEMAGDLQIVAAAGPEPGAEPAPPPLSAFDRATHLDGAGTTSPDPRLARGVAD